ncbi:MAG: hypothetical protein Q7U53_01885 [Anaerolineaceae bacterium]|nr:hypothetical protein [Anaerolineaceae bacterium]
MNPSLERCLEDLEERIDPDEEDLLYQSWKAFIENQFQGDFFFPQRKRTSPPRVEWPLVSINSTLENFDNMVLQQYCLCSQQLEKTDGNLLSVRCNYGTSIIPLLFGVQPFIMEESAETLPISHPLNDLNAIKKLISQGVPDLKNGFGARVFAMGEYFKEIGKQFPKIGRYVHVYHPDLQGPMDICELVWGSQLFLDVVDHPEMVHDFLALVTETYAAFMRAWEQVYPFQPDGNVHWGMLHKGTIMLRDDSGTNFSQRMYENLILPYDQQLLNEFGGGAIHFCGKGDHFIALLGEMHGLHAIQLSQPHLNDMPKVYQHTVDRGIKLIGLDFSAVEQAIAAGIDFMGQVHSFEAG